MRLFQFINRFKKAKVGCVLLALATPLHADDLPQLGETSSLYLSPKKEYEIGQLIVAQIKNQGGVLDDLLVTHYIAQLQKRLTHMPNTELPEWFVLQDRTLNAFALPGGFIGIHTGLVENLDDEDEMAAVLAHEWAHVTQHHLARLAELSGLMNLTALAGAIASVAIATQNPNAGAGALSATLGGASQTGINFTRENEAEADRIGMQILVQANFDPHAMPDVFLHFQREERLMGRSLSELLSTHPLSASRIADASNRADHYPKKPRENSLSFLLVKTHLNLIEQATGKKSASAATAFLDEHPSPYKDLVQTYAKAYAAILEDDHALACQTLSPVENTDLFFTMAKVECSAGLQQYDKANQLLDTLLTNPSYYRPATLAKAELLLQRKQVFPAVTLIQRYLRKAPEDGAAHQLLAKAFSQKNDFPRMHEAEAEYRFYSGDFYGALSQFQMALKLSKVPSISQKRIQAKIKMTQNKIDLVRAL